MLNKLNLIISREYVTRVRKKSFIIVSILAPIGILLLMAVPTLLQFAGSETTTNVAVIDKSQTFCNSLKSTDDVVYTVMNDEAPDSMKQNFAGRNYQAFLHITGTPDEKGNVTLYSENTLSLNVRGKIESDLNESLRTHYMNEYAGDRSTVDSLFNKISSAEAKLTTINISKDGTEQEDSTLISSMLSIIISVLIYFVIILYGNMVMTGVVEEKRNRVVEVLISSVTPFELMMGKIVGIALVALTQFLIWIALIGVGLTVYSLAFAPAEVMSASAATVDTEGIMQSLASVDFNTIGICFVLYFVFGYLLYASLFAWIGSTLDNPMEGQQITLLATLPLCVALYISLYAMQDPESSVVWWGSMIPFTSPIVMIARLPYGVPVWELAVSTIVLIATFVASTWMAARIYRMTILMYGKNVTLKEVFKNFRRS